MRVCYVYLLTTLHHTAFYIGVTNDLTRRIAEHKIGALAGFIRQYNVSKLVHFETYSSITDAIAREKQISAGSRAKKLALINAESQNWEKLAG